MLRSLLAGSISLAVQGVALCQPTFQQQGNASYYSDQFQGKRTASGEKFDKRALTCAHRELAFGTQLQVTCLATGKSVVVRVNDRGPYHGNRIIDLSYAAAQQIGLVQLGIARVRLQVVAPGTSPPLTQVQQLPLSKTANKATKPVHNSSTATSAQLKTLAGATAIATGWGLQLGAFQDEQTAIAFAKKISALKPVYLLVVKTGSQAMYKVVAGQYPSAVAARKALKGKAKKLQAFPVAYP